MAKYDSNKLPTLAARDKFYVYVETGELVECEPQSTDFFLDEVKENGKKTLFCGKQIPCRGQQGY